MRREKMKCEQRAQHNTQPLASVKGDNCAMLVSHVCMNNISLIHLTSWNRQNEKDRTLVFFVCHLKENSWMRTHLW